MGRLGCAVGAVLVVLLSSVSPPVAAARPVTAVDPPSRAAFIDALAAIPGTTEALATARLDLLDAQARSATARSVAIQTRKTMQTASEALHELILVRTRAELAEARAQEQVDDAARQLYSSGGTVPTLVEVMLTSASEEGLVRSLVTRQYLSAAADSRVQAGLSAHDAAIKAEDSAVQRAVTWRIAGESWGSARENMANAARDALAAKVTVDRAQKKYKKVMKITSADRSADYGRIKKCGDWLTKLLSKTGFAGENLREAWAIVMRESGGREDAISVSNDLGLFQINTSTWQEQPWFDHDSLLKRKFNAKVGFLLSQGGDSWYSWGLDGHGRPDAGAYVNAGWTPDHIVKKIIEPYVLWYSLYPCRPSYEKDTWLRLPIDVINALKPRADDGIDEPLAAGGGQLPSAETRRWCASDGASHFIPDGSRTATHLRHRRLPTSRSTRRRHRSKASANRPLQLKARNPEGSACATSVVAVHALGLLALGTRTGRRSRTSCTVRPNATG